MIVFVLICFVYCFFAGVNKVIFFNIKELNLDDYNSSFAAIFWPIALPYYIGILLFKTIIKKFIK